MAFFLLGLRREAICRSGHDRRSAPRETRPWWPLLKQQAARWDER